MEVCQAMNYLHAKGLPNYKSSMSGDESVDLFGEDPAAEAAAKELAEKKKAEKPKGKGGKSSLVLDVKPASGDTDLVALEARIRGLKIEGLEWKAAETKPLAFGVKFLRISSNIMDDVVSVDDVEEKIMAFNDGLEEDDHIVSSCDVFAFNKL
eukprot:TRINITY_DN543_c0_g2_i1.p1 TRINITY_DN543_c0_g2~~TRINITY_DN543_c0_g2_i1.p1  ORF type:complete len:153 (+),score=55.85 TRINITY_DN543_c0_g2_i1:1-459(+)